MRPLVTLKDVVKHYPLRQGWLSALFRGSRRHVSAVDGISLHLNPGEVVALVGESGCGKTTTGKLLVGLERPTGGSIEFSDSPQDREHVRVGRNIRFRTDVQMVFQDPYDALDPRFTVFKSVAEPLRNARRGLTEDEIATRVRRSLEQAGLTPADSYFGATPDELSGGQRQRVVIARAIVNGPRLIVADEPVSMLDVSIRAGIMNLLGSLSRDMGVAILLITHDLTVASYLSDRIAVMYLGKIVEIGDTEVVLRSPRHPYTQALVAAAPSLRGRPAGAATPLSGEPPNAAAVPSGCRFHPRCPLAEAECSRSEPRLVADQVGRSFACHVAERRLRERSGLGRGEMA